jgi:hypothetical protein
MRLKSLLIVMILLMAGGCATYRDDSLARMKTLPLHYEKFDVQMAWEVKSAQGSTVIDGVVKNIRYFEMSQLQIQVSSLDDKGKNVHHAVDFINTLRENEAGAFTLKLPQLEPGSSLRFIYSYIGTGGGRSGGISWEQSFESKVP